VVPEPELHQQPKLGDSASFSRFLAYLTPPRPYTVGDPLPSGGLKQTLPIKRAMCHGTAS